MEWDGNNRLDSNGHSGMEWDGCRGAEQVVYSGMERVRHRGMEKDGEGWTQRGSCSPPCPSCSIDEDEDRYPRKLAFAECLCTGCVDVKTGRETTALNSVLIHQTMMVLRRKPCPRPSSPGLITFEVDYIRVPVGCTCVLPRTGR